MTIKQKYEKINDPAELPQGKFADRSLVRMAAFQILYQNDQNPGSLIEFGESFLQSELPNFEPLLQFGRQLIHGVYDREKEIDAVIQQHSQHWAVSRMSTVDRNILRLAAFELLFTDTPKPVIINEAVELAKKFGTADSSSFVNAVLDNLGRN